MTQPLVSVLIPCYNAGRWLADTLESALGQTWPEREIIVVNDGSTDNSLSIARSFAARGVATIDQPNAGQSAAFNTAIRASKGEFLEFLDADDLLAPDKIERQMAVLSSEPPDTVASCSWGRFVDDPAAATFIPEGVWRDLDPISWLVASWEGGGMMHGAAWLVPRSLVDRAGLWTPELSLINDFDFFTRVLLESRKVVFVAGARTYYRSAVPGSLSNTAHPKAIRSAFTALQLGTRALLARDDSPRTRHASAASFQRFVHSYYPSGGEYCRAAEAEIRRLGGARLRPAGGRGFQLLARLIGWKLARHCQRLWFRLSG